MRRLSIPKPKATQQRARSFSLDRASALRATWCEGAAPPMGRICPTFGNNRPCASWLLCWRIRRRRWESINLDLPHWAFCPDEEWAVVDVHLRNGSMLRGFARNRAEHDIHCRRSMANSTCLTDSEYTEDRARDSAVVHARFMGTSQQNRDLIAYLARLGRYARGAAELRTPSDHRR